MLLSLQVLFIREHNYQARLFKKENDEWDDECIFQKTKNIVTASFQNIVYNEFLPAILTQKLESPRYDSKIDVRALNEFSHAAFRLHSMVNEDIELYNPINGERILNYTTNLRNTFFNTDLIRQYGIDPFLMGMFKQSSEQVSTETIDSLRDFLYYKNGAPLDLFVIDIVRGREIGLPHYTKFLQQLCNLNLTTDCSQRNGLLINSWSFITKNGEMQKRLSALYGTDGYKNLDLIVGLLLEEKISESSIFGPSQEAIIREQFRRLRDGDTQYFEFGNNFNHEEIQYIKSRTMKQIIIDNTVIEKNLLPKSLFSIDSKPIVEEKK